MVKALKYYMDNLGVLEQAKPKFMQIEGGELSRDSSDDAVVNGWVVVSGIDQHHGCFLSGSIFFILILR